MKKSDSKQNTTRIAKNTLALYFRQILIMLVSLYTVYVVLDSDNELLNEEEIGWEKVDSLNYSEFISKSVNKQPLNQTQSNQFI